MTGSAAITRRVTVLGASVVAALCGIAMLGWLFDNQELTHLWLHQVPMRFNTAVSLLLLAAGASAAGRNRRILNALSAVLPVTSLAEYATHASWHIDTFASIDGGHYPGRIALITCVALLLCAAGAELHGSRGRIAQVLLFGAVLLSCGAELGYLYGVNLLSHFGSGTIMSVPTAIAVDVLAIITLVSVPDGFAPWLLFSETPGAALLRRLVPAVLCGIPVIGWIGLTLQREGLVTAQAAITMRVIGSSTIILVVAHRIALRLDEADAGRRAATQKLVELNSQLEGTVRERSEALAEQDTVLGMLKQQSRVAHDLQDLAVSHLFGALMNADVLIGRPGGHDDEERLQIISDEIDTAIKGIRSSIFDLPAQPKMSAVELLAWDEH